MTNRTLYYRLLDCGLQYKIYIEYDNEYTVNRSEFVGISAQYILFNLPIFNNRKVDFWYLFVHEKINESLGVYRDIRGESVQSIVWINRLFETFPAVGASLFVSMGAQRRCRPGGMRPFRAYWCMIFVSAIMLPIKVSVCRQIYRPIHAIVLTREALQASRFGALEVLFTSMYPIMPCNMARGGKRLSACRTFVAPLATSRLVWLRARHSTVSRDKTASTRATWNGREGSFPRNRFWRIIVRDIERY